MSGADQVAPTRTVQIGVGMGPGTDGLADRDLIVEFGRTADQLGFAHFWVNDHLAWPQPLLDPMVFLSHIAAVTTRIRLATGVYLLGLRSPVSVARQLVSLDYLSQGRAIFGVGVGGEFAEDFASAGLNRADRGRRTDHALRLLRRLLTEDAVSCDDEFLRLDDVSVLPHPVQPHLPIVVGGRSDAALRRAATLADGWMPYFMSPHRVAAGIDKLAAFAAAAGCDQTARRVVAHVFAAFDEDPRAARSRAVAYLSRQYRADMSYAVDSSVAVGPPEACAEFLQGYIDVGVTDLVIRPMADAAHQVSVLAGAASRTLTLLTPGRAGPD